MTHTCACSQYVFPFKRPHDYLQDFCHNDVASHPEPQQLRRKAYATTITIFAASEPCCRTPTVDPVLDTRHQLLQLDSTYSPGVRNGIRVGGKHGAHVLGGLSADG